LAVKLKRDAKLIKKTNANIPNTKILDQLSVLLGYRHFHELSIVSSKLKSSYNPIHKECIREFEKSVISTFEFNTDPKVKMALFFSKINLLSNDRYMNIDLNKNKDVILESCDPRFGFIFTDVEYCQFLHNLKKCLPRNTLEFKELSEISKLNPMKCGASIIIERLVRNFSLSESSFDKEVSEAENLYNQLRHDILDIFVLLGKKLNSNRFQCEIINYMGLDALTKIINKINDDELSSLFTLYLDTISCGNEEHKYNMHGYIIMWFSEKLRIPSIINVFEDNSEVSDFPIHGLTMEYLSKLNANIKFNVNDSDITHVILSIRIKSIMLKS
jgi:hypothetical protein